MRITGWRGFVPLRHSRFRLLAGGQLASNLGDAFYAVALPWYVLQAHRGAALLGLVLAAYGIARGASLLAGGSAADRWRPWTVMLAADSVRAVLVAVLAVVVATSRPAAWELVPIGVLVGAGDGLFFPGSSAVVPSLLPDEALEAGNAVLSGSAQLSGLVGPAIGGVVVAVTGPAVAFGIDGASFVVSALALAGVLAASRRAAQAPAAVQGLAVSGQQDVAISPGNPDHGGDSHAPGLWRLFRRNRLLQLFCLIPLMANIGAGAAFDIALPVLARGPLSIGSRGYGALVACLAAGGLGGALAAGQLGPGRRPAIRVAGVFLGAGAFLAAVPYLGGAIAAGACLAVSGGLVAIGNVLLMTLLQRWAPAEALGRVMSLIMLGSLGSFPVSVAAGGVAVTDLGPGPVFLIAAFFVILAAFCALTQAEFRHFGMTRPAADTRDDRTG
jgi:MFS family permease